MTILYGVPNLRLRKHQAKPVLKAHSGIQPKAKVTFHCKSEQPHMQHHLRKNFQPLVVSNSVAHTH